jgi:hypothetical protein
MHEGWALTPQLGQPTRPPLIGCGSMSWRPLANTIPPLTPLSNEKSPPSPPPTLRAPLAQLPPPSVALPPVLALDISVANCTVLAACVKASPHTAQRLRLVRPSPSLSPFPRLRPTPPASRPCCVTSDALGDSPPSWLTLTTLASSLSSSWNNFRFNVSGLTNSEGIRA